MLVTEGLVERIGEFENEPRYEFSKRHVLANIEELYDRINDIMSAIWVYYRSPTEEEKSWSEFFLGYVDGWLQELRHNRSSKKRKKREAIGHIVESMLEINKDFEDLIYPNMNQKFKFLMERLLEYIYPAFMRKSFSSENVEERRSYVLGRK
jgi:hypothetical protein